jgi:hypothetical protein
MKPINRIEFGTTIVCYRYNSSFKPIDADDPSVTVVSNNAVVTALNTLNDTLNGVAALRPIPM